MSTLELAVNFSKQTNYLNLKNKKNQYKQPFIFLDQLCLLKLFSRLHGLYFVFSETI